MVVAIFIIFSRGLFLSQKNVLFRNNFNVVTFNVYIYNKRNLHQECNKLNNTFKYTFFVVVARVNTLFQTSNCRLSYKREKLLTLHEHLDSPLVFGGVRVAQPFSFLCFCFCSSTTKTGRHAIAEILLKVALNTKNQKSIKSMECFQLHESAI